MTRQGHSVVMQVTAMAEIYLSALVTVGTEFYCYGIFLQGEVRISIFLDTSLSYNINRVNYMHCMFNKKYI